MPKPFVVWKLTEQSKDYYFQAPENHYNGAITATNTGVTIATDVEAAKYPLIKVEALLKSSVATRRRLAVVQGSGATANRHTLDSVIATSTAGAFDLLQQGSYTRFNGQASTITGTIEPLRASFF